MIFALLFACPAPADGFTRALTALEAGDHAAVKAEIHALDDPLARDMLRLRLAEAVPSAGGRLCPEMTTTYGKEKCSQVVGRPHLQGVGAFAPTPLQSPPPAVHPTDCDREPAVGLRTLCLVQVAADRARAADAPEALAACAAVPEGVWRAECHFRAGEELAKAGRLSEGLASCADAGRFRTFCFTHAVWGAPPDRAPLAAWEALAGPFTDVEGVANLRARWWFNFYYGTGTADAAAARDAPVESQAAARGAWALEAVRLADGNLDRAAASWLGEPLTGAVLPPPERVGRYDLPFGIPAEQALLHLPGFGGGARLVGETVEEDVAIVLLEGAWFRERAGAASFEPFLDDPRPRVRYTALRAWRTLPSATPEARLTPMLTDPDPIVRAHAEDALKYRTWLGKGHAPGLRPRPTSAP